MKNHDYKIRKRNKTDVIVKTLLFIYLFPLLVFLIIGAFNLKEITLALSALLAFITTIDFVLSTIRFGLIILPIKSKISIIIRRYIHLSSKFLPLIIISMIYLDQKFVEIKLILSIIIFLVYQIIAYTLYRQIKNRFGIDSKFWSIRYFIKRNKLITSGIHLFHNLDEDQKLSEKINDYIGNKKADMNVNIYEEVKNGIYVTNHSTNKTIMIQLKTKWAIIDWNKSILEITKHYSNKEYYFTNLSKSILWLILEGYEDANKIISDCIENGLKDKTILSLKGYCLINLQQFEQAITCYTELLQNNSPDYMIWYNMGFALYKIGNIAEAKNCFTKSLELNTSNLPSWTGKGTCEIELKQYNSAIDTYNNALKISNTRKTIWHGKGIAHQMINENSIAIECYEKALSIDPSFERSRKRRNELLNQ